MKKFLFLALLMAGIALVGCASTLSENIRTAGMYITYTVTHASGESSATAKAVFQVGGITGTFLSLTSGDTITCNGVSLSETRGLLGDISYNTSLTYETNGNYVFAFNRVGDGPYSSSVSLPDHVTISTPTEGSNQTQGVSLEARWNSGISDDLTVTFTKRRSSSPILYSGNVDKSATSYIFPAYQTTIEATVASVEAQVEVSRFKDGTMGSLSGSIKAKESHEIDFNLVP